MSQNAAPLNRALSKLGVLSRSQATVAIRAGRVSVNGRVVRDPLASVVPERARIELDGHTAARQAWRTILLHKPRGVMTTRRDPQRRPTIYDVLGEAGRGLVAVGRLDLATSGLIVLTTDTQMANWIADPANAVPRVYVVTVRGRVEQAEMERLLDGIGEGRDWLRAAAITLRKASSRESHLTVELREGRNREVRRLFAAVGHEVTRLKRVRLGGLDLGTTKPGEWRKLPAAEIALAFPDAPVRV
ncbi:MAG: pseudouridine synthase [Vicinamibacterales bacterium]